ncbi:MAG: conjugal transfer protein [Streptococcaceae bacterium]|nr:conjugal transfer protein [Streptococcaceae bacterium]
METFFKLYPRATEKELSYNLSNQALTIINKDYVFVELMNPVYIMKNDKVIATAVVKYLKQETNDTVFTI